MATHTPGPYQFGWPHIVSLAPELAGSPSKGRVATVWLGQKSSASFEADGLLLAAAPDMLAALEAEVEAQRLTDEEVEMIEYHAAHGMDDITGGSHCFSAGKRADEAWEKARALRDAAIAKARGAKP